MMKKAMMLLLVILMVSAVHAGWTELSDMATARDQFAAALADDALIVFGGNGNPDQMNLGLGEQYSFASNSWQSITPFPDYFDGTGVEEVRGAFMDGTFYVFGAWGDDPANNYDSKILNFNQAYDTQTQTWSTLADKPSKVSGPEIAMYNNLILICGGEDGDENITAIEAYDPAANSWQVVTAMPKGLAKPAIAVWEDRLYVIGGYDFSENEMSDDVMMYDFVSDTWNEDYCQIPNSLVRAFGNATVYPVVNGRVFLAGGFERRGSGFKTSKQVTILDLVSKQWSSLDDLPEARGCHATVLYDNKLYVVGGYADENNLNRAKDTVLVYDLADIPEVPESFTGGTYSLQINVAPVNLLAQLPFTYVNSTGQSSNGTIEFTDLDAKGNLQGSLSLGGRDYDVAGKVKFAAKSKLILLATYNDDKNEAIKIKAQLSDSGLSFDGIASSSKKSTATPGKGAVTISLASVDELIADVQLSLYVDDKDKITGSGTVDILGMDTFDVDVAGKVRDGELNQLKINDTDNAGFKFISKGSADSAEFKVKSFGAKSSGSVEIVKESLLLAD